MQNYYGPSLPPQPAYKDQFQTHHPTYLIPPQPPTPIGTCKISLYHEIVWYISVVKMIWFILSYDWYATIRVSWLVIFLSWQSKFFLSYDKFFFWSNDKLMVKGKHVPGYILIPLNYFILVQPLPTFFFWSTTPTHLTWSKHNEEVWVKNVWPKRWHQNWIILIHSGFGPWATLIWSLQLQIGKTVFFFFRSMENRFLGPLNWILTKKTH